MSVTSGTVYVGKRASKTPEAVDFQKESNKLEELEKRANLIIFEANSMRPLFSKNKHKITICPNRITITRGSWFSSEEYPMAVENITGARIYRHFMYAALEIDTFGVVKPEPIKHMRVDDARLARRYILALIECKKANIDLSGFKLEDLREKLKDLGMVRYTSSEKNYHNI